MPVHLRLNDKDTSRNPYINFVTALPGQQHDEALHRLQQLAAMVKPLMKQHGFHINSLEQYEWNREFAGRCWNNGEVVELVLTSAQGAWMPLQYVLYVFCHELAHIKHMNHIPSQHGALTSALKQMALEKQRQGYYGDGLWSAGRQLGKGSFVDGLGMQQQRRDNLPQHVCGGAFSRKAARSAGRKRRRTTGKTRQKYKGPSLHSGAQTAPNTRGGNRRVTLDVAAKDGGGEAGTRVDGRNWLPTATAKDAAYKKDENSTFRKRTQSKDAREKRASAALARFAAAAATVKDERAVAAVKDEDGDTTSGDDVSDSDSVTEEEEDIACGNMPPTQPHFTQGWRETAEQRVRRMQRFEDRQGEADAGNVKREDEWESLLEEARAPSAGGLRPTPGATADEDDEDDEIVFVEERPAKRSAQHIESTSRAHAISARQTEWVCLLCTLTNDSAHKRCAACDTTRGKSTLGE